jgi:ATP-dependent DNA ligase
MGHLLRYRRHDQSMFLYAFDLIELNGDDLRREPLVVRKATLVSVLAKASRTAATHQPLCPINGASGARSQGTPRKPAGNQGMPR